MNPLNVIKTFLQTLPEDLCVELILLGNLFHPDKNIAKSSDREKLLIKYLEYLEYDSLELEEIVRRNFMVQRLIDFGLSGRDTNEVWQEMYDRHLTIAAKASEEGSSTRMADEFFLNYEDNRDTWINIGKSWTELKSTVLSDKNVADWYFVQFIDSRK